jgi:hypothetical protein
MATGADAPLFAQPETRYPVLAFSHGYAGSPLSDDYLSALSWFASHGYVVVAPFHGDPRISDVRIDDFDDAVFVLSHLTDFTALQALRPLSMSAALDLVLAHPVARPSRRHADRRLRGMGGETLMLMGGAEFTVTAGLSSTQITFDPRLKAAVGYVPYFGALFLPAFGRDQQGLDNVTLPYLAISGTADTTAPLVMVQQGIARLAERASWSRERRQARLRRRVEGRHLHLVSHLPRCRGARRCSRTSEIVDDGECRRRRRRPGRDSVQRRGRTVGAPPPCPRARPLRPSTAGKTSSRAGATKAAPCRSTPRTSGDSRRSTIRSPTTPTRRQRRPRPSAGSLPAAGTPAPSPCV